MNIQERIEALETEFAEKIKALKAEAQQEKEFPQFGDDYWFVDSDTEVMDIAWYGGEYDQGRLSIGNVFKTKEEAEFAVEKLKVEAELRKFSSPFEEDENNYFIQIDSFYKSITIEVDDYYPTQGTIYFESEDKAQQAIESIGADRIKKYLFGVED